MVKPTGPVPGPEGTPPTVSRPPLRVPLSKALTLQLQVFRRKHGRDGYQPAAPDAIPMPEDLPDETLEQAKDRLGRFDQAVTAAQKRLEAADQKVAQSEAKLVATRAEIAAVQKDRMELGERILGVQKQIADVDRRRFQLAERKADLLIRIADQEAKLGAAPEAEFQAKAKDLKVLEAELTAVRTEHRELTVQRRSLVRELGTSVAEFAAGAMATVEDVAKRSGRWLLEHSGPLRRPLEAVGRWAPLRWTFELAGKAWNSVEGFFGRRGKAGPGSEREIQLLEQLAEAATKAYQVRKAELAAGRAKAVAEDKELAGIETKETTLATERAGLAGLLADYQGQDRVLAEKSTALKAREAEEQRQFDRDREARELANRQYEEARDRKIAEEKRYWELYDQRKRDEQRHADQSAEKKRDDARQEAGRLEARRLETLADEVRRLTAHATEAGAPDHAIGTTSTGQPIAAIDEGTVNRAREAKQRVKEAAKVREEAVTLVAKQLDAVAQLADDKVASLAPGQEKFSVADSGTVARHRYRRTLLGS